MEQDRVPPAFDLYFALIVASNQSPGKSLQDCAKQALDMLTIRDFMFQENKDE